MASPKKKWLRIKAAEDAVKAEAKVAEDAAIKVYEEMTVAKKKWVAALQKSIEEKLQRVADWGVNRPDEERPWRYAGGLGEGQGLLDGLGK